MTRHNNDHTTHDTHDTISQAGDYLPRVADRVQAALDGLKEQFIAISGTRPTTEAGWAARSAALALISARRAGWWRVLSRAGYRDTTLHWLFAEAALIACEDAQESARFWRGTAAEYRARAEGRPTSDAAGALSNWHELGVTA
jgi:hypothetical protein